jgi:hypothetical protein
MLLAPSVKRSLYPENVFTKGPREQNCPHEEEQQSTSFSDTSCFYTEKGGDGTQCNYGGLETDVTL